MVSMSTFDASKHPRGQVTNAGQFRIKENDAPTAQLTLPPGAEGFLARKREALLARGFVPATPGPSTAGTPLSAKGIENWWVDAIVRSEVRTDGMAYPVIPDDYTPSGGVGRALSGRRRTYRKVYQSGELSVRMPSVSAIRRFSAENDNETFDVPVSAEGPAGNPISGHVRVTQTSPGRWVVTAINMPPAAQSKVAEAVNAILEARRPTYALAEIEHAGGLLARAKERRAAAGASLVKNETSAWIRATGYNDETGEAILNLQGRHYGYEVPRGVYDYVTTASSPGAAYNALIKGRYESHAVDECSNCGRWYRQGSVHACPDHRAPTGNVTLHSRRIQAFVLGEPLPARV